MKKKIPILLGSILLAVAIWASITTAPTVRNFLTRLDNLTYDMQLQTKLFATSKQQQSSVIIIDVDDKSLKAEGHWPWSRIKLAELVQALQEAGVAVIAFDITFPEQEVNQAQFVLDTLQQKKVANAQVAHELKKIIPAFDADKKFATTLRQSDTVLGVTFLAVGETAGVIPRLLLKLNTQSEQQLGFIKARGFINNISLLQQSAKSDGFLNVFSDQDGVVRRVPLLLRYENSLYPSLALEATRLYLFESVKLITATYGKLEKLEGIQLGKNVIPTNDRGEVVIPFRGGVGSFSYLSATDALHKKIPPGILQGKIAFVGTSAVGLGDLQTTAIQSAYPGVEVHATVADGILKNNFPYRPAWALGAEITVTLLVGIILIFTFPYFGPWLLSTVTIAIPIVLVLINRRMWEQQGLILSTLIPILLTLALAMLNAAYGFLFETRRREKIKRIFGQYVASEHIDEMLRERDSYGLHGEEREMTVLFADIRSFTSISEPLKASQVKDFLNEFLTPMTKIIFDHKGTIDKYVGDMIMAFWGAPLQDKQHAEHAVVAALAMQAELKKLRPIFIERGLPEVHIGVGLNTGLMNVGDMGSEFRRNYTVLGDAVNLASRLESLTKQYGVEIIVGEDTYQTSKQKFVYRQLDRVRVKGKQTGMNIYEVLCVQSELTDTLSAEIKLSEAALQSYFNQQWDRSEDLFNQLLKLYPDKKLYSLYLHRIKQYRSAPPAEDWNGIYIFTQK